MAAPAAFAAVLVFAALGLVGAELMLDPIL
jgi:hypothetical protein